MRRVEKKYGKKKLRELRRDKQDENSASIKVRIAVGL
jgi:hypothetical protein